MLLIIHFVFCGDKSSTCAYVPSMLLGTSVSRRKVYLTDFLQRKVNEVIGCASKGLPVSLNESVGCTHLRFSAPG